MLLEREAELAVLLTTFDQLPTAGGRVVLVRGEAGTGKTALIDEFIDRVAGDATVLLGSCDDLLTPQPLGPIWDMSRTESVLATALESDDRRAVFESMLELLDRRLRPTVAVVEDSHWADDATLDIIKFLGRRVERTSGLLIVSYRDGEVDSDHPLRRVIGDLSPDVVVRLRVGALSESAVAAITGDPERAAEVLAVTGGNALFVTELAAAGSDGLTASIQDAVMARVARLSQPARALVDLVSVAPGGLERVTAERVLDTIDQPLREAEHSRLLIARGGVIAFAHELQRRAVEASLSDADRESLNQRLLDTMSDRTEASRLAHHAREARDADAIVIHVPLAAREAAAMASHREAARHFRSLEGHLESFQPADRAVLVEEWARSEFYIDNQEALHLLDRAIELHRQAGDTRGLARALTFAVRVNEVNGRPEQAQQASREALELLLPLGPGDDLAFALSQRAWLALMQGVRGDAVEYADEAMEMARRVDDELSLIHALNTKGTSLLSDAGDPTGWELLEEARRRAADAEEWFEEVRALHNMGDAALCSRDTARTLDLAERTRVVAARYETSVLEVSAITQRAEAAVWSDKWDYAEDLAFDALGAHPHVEVTARRIIGLLAARRGRADAVEHLRRAWELADRSQEPQHLVPTAAACAEAAWLGYDTGGDRSRWVALVHTDSARSREWWKGALAHALWKLGDLDVPVDGIPKPYALMMQGEVDAAAAEWVAIGGKYEKGLALMDGDDEDGLRALRIFEDLGAASAADRVRSDLAARGMRVPRGRGRSTRRNPAGLTGRQAEVLELLADGLSNAEIADLLFVSPRTVENHVSSVLTKLDASDRKAAVAIALERGLVST